MQLLIKGYTFSLSSPFDSGHSLTAGEAQALNDLRKENIQNNFRSFVNDQVANLAPGQLLAQNVLDGLQAQLTEYDSTYRFNEKAGRNRTGDIEQEAKNIALERIRQELAAMQRNDPAFSPADWTANKTDALAAKYAKLPSVQEEARSRVSARRSALAGGMESL